MNIILNKRTTLVGIFMLSVLAFALSPALVNAASLAGASQGTKATVNFMPYSKEFGQAYALVYGNPSVSNFVPPVYSVSVLDPYASSRSLQSLASTSFYRLYSNAWLVTPTDCSFSDPAAFGFKQTNNKCVGFSAKNTLTGESFTNPGFIFDTKSSINWAAVVQLVAAVAVIYFAPAAAGTTWAAIGSSISAGYAATGYFGDAALYGTIAAVTRP